MLNLSMSCKYALRALRYLACGSGEDFVKIQEIAQKEQIPHDYLRKILQTLVRQQILISGVGPRGGVRLPAENRQIDLARVIEIFDGPAGIRGCSLFGYPKCPKLDRCPIHDDCTKINRTLRRKMAKFTLADLSNEQSTRRVHP